VVRCAVFVLLALAVSSGQIVALALVAGIASGFARPAAYAGLPNLVSEELLPRANSLLRTADQLTIMIGTVVGGVLVAASGPDLAYWLNAASFAISAALVVRISASLLQKGRVESRGHWHDVAEGFTAIVRSRPLLTVLVSWSIATVTMAIANVAEVFLATVSFDAGSFGYGLMWTASGLGAVLGALFASSWLERRGMTAVYASAIALMGLGDIAAGVSPNVWVAVWCVLLGGIGNAAAIVCNSLLVQRGAPDHLRGRVFTVLIGATSAVLGIGMALTGPLVDSVGPRWAYVIAGGVALVAAAAGFVMLRREPAHLPEPVTS
jgi:MFS family permease